MTGITGIEIKDKEDRNVLHKKDRNYLHYLIKNKYEGETSNKFLCHNSWSFGNPRFQIKKSKNQKANKSNMIKEKRKESKIA